MADEIGSSLRRSDATTQVTLTVPAEMTYHQVSLMLISNTVTPWNSSHSSMHGVIGSALMIEYNK